MKSTNLSGSNSVYQPSEDSFLFVDFLKEYISKLSKSKRLTIRYLDMGTGSGILAETAHKSGIIKHNIFAADINPQAIEHMKSRGFNAIETDLFSKINKSEKFNIITFNAPYLPEDKYDKQKDTSGGKKGDEASIKFLKKARLHLEKDGVIFLLISSHTPQDKINKFGPKIVARKKIFFEELLILEFR
ncbi:MAG: HemK2/MTQ2 family protein methyltransferase [archaeon]